MIENTLLHFKTTTAFDAELNAGNIQNTSIVFINESKKIWTHGEYFGGETDLTNYATKEDIASINDTIGSINTLLDTINGEVI